MATLAACGGGRSGGGGVGSAADVSTSASTVAAVHSVSLVSDGVADVTIAIEVRDAAGRGLPGRRLFASASGDGNTFWPAASVTTDAAGEATLRLTSTTPGRKRVSVSADPNGTVVLDDAPEVEFVPPVVPRKRVSVSSAGAEGADFSRQPAVSGNGRYVAFQSKADNLVPGDSNQKEDVFVHDLQSGVTERVSLTPSGSQFTDLCGRPSLSDSGLEVAFEGRERDDDEIFLRDRAAGATISISRAAGLAGRCFDPALSGDGRHVAFVCNDGESQQVWVIDRLTLARTLVSKNDAGQRGDDPSWSPSISRDGRWVAFSSTADNLVAGDSNEKQDVFVHDRISGTTTRYSLSANGAQGNDDSTEPAIAADGRGLAFTSKAANLVPGDDNGKADVFFVDLATRAIQRVSVDPRGAEVDKESGAPALNADATQVVFVSLSDDIVDDDQNGKWDVFRRDLPTGRNVRVSLARGGGDPNEFSVAAATASDAPIVAFESKASNLVGSDSNDQEDVFVAPR